MVGYRNQLLPARRGVAVIGHAETATLYLNGKCFIDVFFVNEVCWQPHSFGLRAIVNAVDDAVIRAMVESKKG